MAFSAAERIGYPVVLKGVASALSRLVTLVRDILAHLGERVGGPAWRPHTNDELDAVAVVEVDRQHVSDAGRIVFVF